VKKTNMKKGITLIEIILAIVLIAIILGLTIPKLMKNSQNTEIKQAISSDVKAIIEAAVLWKKSHKSDAATGYKNIDSNALNSRLPENMTVINGWIPSAGLKTGEGNESASGVRYTVTYKFRAEDNASIRTFSIGMNTTPGSNNLNWSDKTVSYALETFENAINSITDSTDEDTATAYAGVAGKSAAINCGATSSQCIKEILINQ